MHELSVCQALVRQLRDIAREQRAARITRVVVQIGPLSGVEPELLRHAYPVASAGSPAADAALILEALPIRIHCESCGADSDAAANRLLCGACGDYRTRLISGDELLLASVELEAEPASAATH
ncbi:MAG: hydrogenase maturation nickel metallochaperone HypA [Gammaproteobacteria bacterium]|jgi:hydrogenase nickel incorporation protein HypA/HybF|nr:hydrogenase maturation nickel metallochaperone HypA [Gammaproteobacteria bacterium]